MAAASFMIMSLVLGGCGAASAQYSQTAETVSQTEEAVSQTAEAAFAEDDRIGIISAMDNEIDYAVDVYPMYGSDAEASLRAGNDLRHGLIGAGVYASHGYERSHKDGAENTLKLLIAYLLQ